MTVGGIARALFLAGCYAALGAAPASAAATDWAGDPRAQVRLVTGSDTVGQATLRAGLEFSYAPGWHGYWRTPGDAGIAPVLDWAASNNLKTEAVAWPAPKRLVVSGLQNSVYEGRFILPLALERDDLHAGMRIALAVDYAACSNICVPAHADLALTLPLGTGADSTEAPALADASARVPGAPAAAGVDVVRASLSLAGSASDLVVEVQSQTAPFVAPDLFVEGVGDGQPPAPTVQLLDGGRRARMTAKLPGDRHATSLIVTLVDGARSAEFRIPSSSVAVVRKGRGAGAGWIAVLASALLGGLVLNLMPCVLPILSIKLFSLSRHAGAERRVVRFGFVATALGIVACFLGLAAALIVLKLSGATIGWGIQFQQPWFLAGMAVLTVVFAASFFEWLPIGLPQVIVRLSGTRSRVAFLEAFLAGVFSTLLATPCSAPFVGTAVGFALAQGPKEILAVFLCLGIGMAAPFLCAAALPGMVAWLPRPGSWILRLRQGLGILLLATAGWLLFVLGTVAGPLAAATSALLLAALLGFRWWVTSNRMFDRRSWSWIGTAGLAAAALVVATLPFDASRSEPPSDGWQAFDSERLGRDIAEGKTVLVDVTASWCLTCKVNEIAALETAPVRARLARPGTIRMRADWSRPDPAITAYLQGFGRFGIPLDVVYGPARPEGEALPELLTADTLVAALDRADARSSAVDESSQSK
jgi:suppressor for copper-sensitivity B